MSANAALPLAPSVTSSEPNTPDSDRFTIVPAVVPSYVLLLTVTDAVSVAAEIVCEIADDVLPAKSLFATNTAVSERGEFATFSNPAALRW